MGPGDEPGFELDLPVRELTTLRLFDADGKPAAHHRFSIDEWQSPRTARSGYFPPRATVIRDGKILSGAMVHATITANRPPGTYTMRGHVLNYLGDTRCVPGSPNRNNRRDP